MSIIVAVIHRYYEDWEPPEDDPRRDWLKCLCPFHGETRKSACVSFEHDAFICYACPVKGDAIALIRMQEGVTYAEAKLIVAELSPGGHEPVSRKPARKPGRRVFEVEGVVSL